MKIRIQPICSVSICLVLATLFLTLGTGKASQTKTARIKLKSGQVVEGQIRGVIVQRGAVERVANGLGIKYYPINGKDVEYLDARGIQLAQESASLAISLSNQEKLPTDEDVLKTAMGKWPGPRGKEDPPGLHIGGNGEIEVAHIGEGQVGMITFSVGDIQYLVKVSYGGKRVLNKDKVLGTVKIEKENVRVIPTLEVATDKGIVTVNINEIERPDQ